MKSIPEMSQETRLIIIRLRKLEENDTITYADLQGLMPGNTDRSKLRQRVASAAASLNRDEGVVIACVRGMGYKRLPANEIPAVLTQARAGVGRRMRRATKRVIRGTTGRTLTEEAKRCLYLELSLAGAFEQITRPKSAALVEAKIKAANGELPSKDILIALTE